MKNLKLFVLAFVFGSATLFASENPMKERMEKNDEIRTQVVKLFNNAEFATYEDFDIKLTFTFNQNDKIVILGVNTERQDIKEYVKKNMNLVKFKTLAL